MLFFFYFPQFWTHLRLRFTLASQLKTQTLTFWYCFCASLRLAPTTFNILPSIISSWWQHFGKHMKPQLAFCGANIPATFGALNPTILKILVPLVRKTLAFSITPYVFFLLVLFPHNLTSMSFNSEHVGPSCSQRFVNSEKPKLWFWDALWVPIHCRFPWFGTY